MCYMSKILNLLSYPLLPFHSRHACVDAGPFICSVVLKNGELLNSLRPLHSPDSCLGVVTIHPSHGQSGSLLNLASHMPILKGISFCWEVREERVNAPFPMSVLPAKHTLHFKGEGGRTNGKLWKQFCATSHRPHFQEYPGSNAMGHSLASLQRHSRKCSQYIAVET